MAGRDAELDYVMRGRPSEISYAAAAALSVARSSARPPTGEAPTYPPAERVVSPGSSTAANASPVAASTRPSLALTTAAMMHHTRKDGTSQLQAMH